MKKALISVTVVLAIALTTGVMISSPDVLAGQKKPSVAKGRNLFGRYCVSCHGEDGKGQGPVAAALKQGPPDLTILQAPGEKFPFARVQTAVDGEKAVAAHGPRRMPVWGTVFRRTKGELERHLEIYALVKYVESIQEAAK